MRDLIRANELIATIAKENPQITPIESGDFDLFQSFFAKEPHTYGNSWTYITQGMYGIGPNKLGYKYYDGKNLSAVCVYPKIEWPDINVFYWIRPMGETIVSVTNDVSHELFKKFSLSVYVKKIFLDQYDALLKNGFTDVKGFPWHSLYPKEDDTYPELILDVLHTLETAKKLGTRDQLGSSYRYYQKFIGEGVVAEDSLFNHVLEARRLLDDFFIFSKEHSTMPIISDPLDYYAMLSGFSKDAEIFDSFFYFHDSPAGFYFAEKNTHDTVSLYALISLRSVSNHVADYIMFSFLHRMEKEGIHYVNLGGSENMNIERFKKKYVPTKSNQMHWVVSAV